MSDSDESPWITEEDISEDGKTIDIDASKEISKEQDKVSTPDMNK